MKSSTSISGDLLHHQTKKQKPNKQTENKWETMWLPDETSRIHAPNMANCYFIFISIFSFHFRLETLSLLLMHFY